MLTKSKSNGPTNRIAGIQTESQPKDPVGLRVIIPKLEIRKAHIRIRGKSPLIVHCWSEKAIKQMLDKQTGEASKGRAPKNPLADFRSSLIKIPEGYGIPAPAFKACAVSAANDVELKMTEMKRAFHVNTYTVPIIAPPLEKSFWTEWDHKHEKELEYEHSKGCSMRQDMVRLESGVADIRFRGCFPIWECLLEVEYNECVIQLAQLVNLFQAGGFGCGIGEWRPSSPKVRSGEFGRFEVV